MVPREIVQSLKAEPEIVLVNADSDFLVFKMIR